MNYCPFCHSDDFKALSNGKYKCNSCGSTFSEENNDNATDHRADIYYETLYGESFARFGSSKALSGDEIFNRIIDGVCIIASSTKAGTGFAIDKDTIISNAHVVNSDATRHLTGLKAIFKKNQYDMFVKYANREVIDISINKLYSSDSRIKPLTLGDSAKVKTGQKIYVVGNSKGEGICITAGIISDDNRRIYGFHDPVFMIDAAANPGNSGGPVFNEQAEVIAILVAGTPDAEGMNYCIPINELKKLLNRI